MVHPLSRTSPAFLQSWAETRNFERRPYSMQIRRRQNWRVVKRREIRAAHPTGPAGPGRSQPKEMRNGMFHPSPTGNPTGYGLRATSLCCTRQLAHLVRMAQRPTGARYHSIARGIQWRPSCGRRCERLVCYSLPGSYCGLAPLTCYTNC